FTSDRGGNPQIYRTQVGSRDQPKRVTFEGKYNARARVAPGQNHIAVVHGANGVYNIGLVDLRDGALVVLTDGRLDESPSFAPNGAMILYATQKSGRAVLAAVSRDGRFHQQLTSSSGDIREPAWSPYIE
ncbi:MAG: Tol-Pal system protein TolB, partial [Gammaproteobacteria bacterium]|nr:Tol-Pal system protein TolB [Gammaproteobacteria bacterium]